MNSRRLLRPHIDAYRAALNEARGDLAQLSFEHACRTADLVRQVDALRSELATLKDVVRRRIEAERELADLRALRDAEPAFGQLLN
jgi:hypothetical protein